MKINIVILILFLKTLSVSAQIKGIIVDENKLPIPYVNIWVEGENIGTTSQEDGTFIINCTEEKILVFSAIGYENQKTALNKTNQIVLKSKTLSLNEVVITTLKKSKELEIGGAKKIHHTQLSGDKPWIYAKLFPFEAIYDETPFLKKIIFFSNSEKNNAKLKIRFFQLEDSIPTNDLAEEDIIVTVKKGMRKNVIDISKYKLRLPKNGVLVGLEWLIIPENFYEFKYKDGKTKKMIVTPNYAPSLVINYNDEPNSFTYSSGKWRRAKKYKLNDDRPWDNKIMTPAINLILTN